MPGLKKHLLMGVSAGFTAIILAATPQTASAQWWEDEGAYAEYEEGFGEEEQAFGEEEGLGEDEQAFGEEEGFGEEEQAFGEEEEGGLFGEQEEDVG
ncbi:hypothetical protein, partial [Arenibaculum sp.]|uniref:hypothetical protein n=1 Tax=Arenibaculum sp. TaxID=2865862 RepID=UPI002E0E701A|nr:hypothetical protein [Arenibaculum sp.]